MARIDAPHAVRRVRSNGEIRWGGELVFVSEAQFGEPVGVAETETGDWIVRFTDHPLGFIDRRPGRAGAKGPSDKPGNLSTMYPVQIVNELSGCT